LKKLNSILSIISLCITSFLLVLLVFAWYATNKQANVNDGVGSVADLDQIVENVFYYRFKNVEENSTDKTKNDYTIDSLTSSSANEALTMNKYGDDENPKPTEYLICIKLKEGKGYSSLQFISSAAYFIGFENGGNGVIKNTTSGGETIYGNENLSLSSVLKFAYVGSTKVNKDPENAMNDTTYIATNAANGIVTLPKSINYTNFEYTHDVTIGENTYTYSYYGGITNSKITMDSITSLEKAGEQGKNIYIYLLLNYNVEAINNFYGYNLGNESILYQAAPAPTFPMFNKKDFQIFILG